MAAKFIGAYDVQAEVLSKITELKAKGYREEDIHVAARNEEQLSMVRGQTDVSLNTGEEEGFMGKFISLLSGEQSARDSFDNLGFDKNESDQYYNQMQDGKLLLFIDGGNSSDSAAIRTHAEGHSPSLQTGRRDSVEEESMELHEERLNVDKKRVQTGEVNVSKRIVEEEQTIEVPVEREEVYVERRPVNEKTASRTDGGLTQKSAYDDGERIHVPVSEEQLEISKKNVVKEEVVIGKRKVHDVEIVKETVRREVVDIDEEGTTGNNGRNPL